VRALLVDKDRNPQWSYLQVADVPDDVLDGFFEIPKEMPSLNLPA